jgi:hypothetical protein
MDSFLKALEEIKNTETVLNVSEIIQEEPPKEFKIYTSYSAKLDKLIQAGIYPVYITGYLPEFIKQKEAEGIISHYTALAPSYLQSKNFNAEEFRHITLDILDIKNVIYDLSQYGGGKDVALIGFYKEETKCHRSIVSDWLKDNGKHCEEWK